MKTAHAPRLGRSRRHDLLSAISSVLMVTGALLILDAVLTVVWQEPLSALYQKLQQDKLDDALKELERRRPSEDQRRALAKLEGDERRMAFLARALRNSADAGDAIGRISARRIKLNAVVVEGTDTASLRKGPGHYPQTPLPGMHGTVAIAGHRTTYGAPFRKINKLGRGDEIVVTMPYGRFTYAVEKTRIVEPTELSVIKRVSFDRLVLSACHPLYSAAKRIIVFARLSDARPRGAALRQDDPSALRETISALPDSGRIAGL